MKIGIHGKDFNRQSADFIKRIFELLTQQKAELFVSNKMKSCWGELLSKILSGRHTNLDSLKSFTFLSIGGDGTLLESITHIGPTETPYWASPEDWIRDHQRIGN